MAITRRSVLSALGAGVLIDPINTSTLAQQTFPSQPIKIVVPYPPGGPFDGVPRVLAKYISDKYGWNIVIENRAGASGLTGILAAKQMAPDGHTLVITTSSTHGSAPAVTKELRYDPFKDLDPVILLADAPMALLVRADIPAHSVAGLIDLLRRNHGKYNYSSGGFASQHHLATAMMFLRAGLPQEAAGHVPFLGLAPALMALVAGDVQFMFTTTGAAMQFVETGVLRPIALSSRARSERLPNVPTMSESGFPDFHIVPWCGIAAPAGTPLEIRLRLNTVINEAMQLKDVKEKIYTLDYDVKGGTLDDYTAFFTKDINQYTKLIKDAGFKLD